MGETEPMDDTQTNVTALNYAIRHCAGQSDDEVVASAVKFRHFIMNGTVMIPPQPEQPA